MPEQLELAVGKPEPVKARHMAARMIAILARRGVWVTRAEFATYGFAPRQCRAACEASHMRVLFGQYGYKLLRYASPDEIRRCLGTIKSMRDKLDAKYIQLNNRAHRALHRRGET